MRAIVYCRVSTKEQTENLSLSTQEKACSDYCEREGYDIDRVFVEKGESAKSADRTQFQALLAYCRETKGRVQALVVYSVNRFARNKHDHVVVRALLAQLGITLRSVTEPIDDTSIGKLMEGVLSSFAQFDNDVKAERTMQGMKDALGLGRWTFQAPLGYGLGFDAASKRTLVHDPERGALVRRAFELFATGVHTQREVLRQVTALGLRSRTGKPLNAQSFEKILRKPIYAGRLVVEKWDVNTRSDFEPLVPPDLFDRVQAILAGRAPTVAPRLRSHPDFPLRRFVRCGSCNRPLTGSKSRGRGKHYPYYSCPNGKCRAISIRKEKLEAKFVELIERLRPKPEYLRLFNEIVRDVWREEGAGAEARRRRLDSRLQDLRSKNDRLDEAYLYERAIDRETYEAQRDRLREAIALAELELHEARLDELDLETVLAYSEHFLANAGRLWTEADLDQRQRLAQVLFPEGLTFDGETFGTAVTCLAFSFFRSVEGGKSTLASLRPPSWNQVIGWLRQVEALRKAA